MPKVADLVAKIMSHVRASWKPAAVAELFAAQRVIKGNVLSFTITSEHIFNIFSGFFVFLSSRRS